MITGSIKNRTVKRNASFGPSYILSNVTVF
jgi:hypothetical protein